MDGRPRGEPAGAERDLIVVDTTVWVDHLNDVQTDPVGRLRDIIRNQKALLIVGDLILCEVLQGLANETQAAAVERALRRFEVVSMVSPALASTAAANYRRLRGRGITVRKTIDMLIGTFCIEGSHQLLHSDRDFDGMARHLGLQVLR